MPAEVRIGTSGWHYKHWVGSFYPEKTPAAKMLAHYVRYFDTVEINNSFYRLPSVATMEAWRDTTPDGFCFAVKGSRFLTHIKRLKDPENALQKFIPVAEKLGAKLGPILFQLPPNLPVDSGRLSSFIAMLPRVHKYAFEFRNPSWHAPEIFRVLAKHNAAFCIYQLAGFHSSFEVTADFTYVRLHGPEGAYQGSYGRPALRAWARRIQDWERTLAGIYVYFDNDMAAFAVRNALALKELVANENVARGRRRVATGMK